MQNDAKNIMINYLLKLYGFPPPIKAMVDKYKKYKLQLKNMSEEELVEEMARVEQDAPFNSPNANADFAYHCRKESWTTEEAIALSLGKDPSKVCWDKIQCYHPFPFVQEYGKRLELLMDSMNSTKFNSIYSTPPVKFVEWAKTKDIKLPSKLIKLVKRFNGVQDIDWKAKYEALEVIHNKCEEENPNAKIFKSFQKLSIGALALMYKPETLSNIIMTEAERKKNNIQKTKHTLASIISDLNRVGIGMDDGNLKKRIQEAIHHLPTEPKK